MTTQEFFQQLDARIAPFDLLCHPFYKAWSAGELSRDDLREYARDYYHHVNAFPTYLAELSMRLEESELRRAVLANLADEKGCDDADGQQSGARRAVAGLCRRHGSKPQSAGTQARCRDG